MLTHLPGSVIFALILCCQLFFKVIPGSKSSVMRQVLAVAMARQLEGFRLYFCSQASTYVSQRLGCA